MELFIAGVLVTVYFGGLAFFWYDSFHDWKREGIVLSRAEFWLSIIWPIVILGTPLWRYIYNRKKYITIEGHRYFKKDKEHITELWLDGKLDWQKGEKPGPDEGLGY